MLLHTRLNRREEGTDLLNSSGGVTRSEPIYNTVYTGTAVSRSGHPQFHPQHPHRSLRTHESAVSQSYIPGIPVLGCRY